MRIWDRIKDFAAYAVAAIIGIAILLFAMFGFVLPQQDKRKRNEAKAKGEALKKKVEEAKAARDVQVEQQVAQIKEETAAKQEEDPVDFANALIAAQPKEKT